MAKYCGPGEHIWDGYGGCLACDIQRSANGPRTAEEKKPVATTERHLASIIRNIEYGRLIKEHCEVTKETPYIPAVVEQLRLTLKGKNEDYAPTTEFSNFELAGALVGVSPRLAIMLQIGIKYSRLTSLIQSDAEANFEGIRDTLMDLAGYSMVAVAHMDKLADDEGRDEL